MQIGGPKPYMTMSLLHTRMQVGQKKTAWLKLKRHRPWMPFLWFVAGSASTGSRQGAKLETHLQTWSISAVANLQNITAVKAISAPTENGKVVLTNGISGIYHKRSYS